MNIYLIFPNYLNNNYFKIKSTIKLVIIKFWCTWNEFFFDFNYLIYDSASLLFLSDWTFYFKTLKFHIISFILWCFKIFFISLMDIIDFLCILFFLFFILFFFSTLFGIFINFLNVFSFRISFTFKLNIFFIFNFGCVWFIILIFRFRLGLVLLFSLS